MTSTREAWKALESQSETHGTARRRIRPESERDLFIELDLANRQRRLTLEATWSPAARMPTLPRTSALDCMARYNADRSQVAVGITLLDPTLNEAFVTVVDDIAERVAVSPDDTTAVSELVVRLSLWQQLFKVRGREGLSPAERRGLFGELLILRDLLIPTVGPDDAVAAWTGPLRANQDFQLSVLAIEVKATGALHPQGFTVNNERELDDSAVEHLMLAHVSLDERRGEGQTLLELVVEVGGLLAGNPVAAQHFQELLLTVGFLPQQSELYREPHYSVREQRWFTVDHTFPRIVEADLAEGVGQVEYRVSLAACTTHETQDGHVVDLLTHGAHP